MKKDLYEILGINKNADASAIKKAYRKLAKKYHPDMNGGDTKAEQKFKEITAAYQILSDPEKRKLYDEFGEAAFMEGFSAERARAAKNYSGNRTGKGFYSNSFGSNDYSNYHFNGDDMEDILGGIFGNAFRSKQNSREFNGFTGFHSASRSAKGQDIESEITISFNDAVFGSDRILTLSSPDSGETQSLKVHIPAGIDDGKTIRLKGKGTPGRSGGAAGDLLLKVKVESKAGFKRKGMDVYTTVQIPYTTAVLGGEVIIQTLYGDVECKIREGTQSGSKIRLRGKGIVSMNNSTVYGDQYVEIQIKVPTHLNAEAKEKLKEYKKMCA